MVGCILQKEHVKCNFFQNLVFVILQVYIIKIYVDTNYLLSFFSFFTALQRCTNCKNHSLNHCCIEFHILSTKFLQDVYVCNQDYQIL